MLSGLYNNMRLFVPFFPKLLCLHNLIHAEGLIEIADHFDVFLLDAFGVLNVGDTAINGAVQRVQMLKNMGKQVLVLTNGACFPVEQALKKFRDFGFSFELKDIVSSRDALAASLPSLPDNGYWGVMSTQNSRKLKLSAFPGSAFKMTGQLTMKPLGLFCYLHWNGLILNRCFCKRV